MKTDLTEQRIGPMRWLVVTGERRDAFLALGEQAKQETRDLVEQMPEVAKLRSRMNRDKRVAAQFRDVAEASSRWHPAAHGELQSLARGAGVDFEDLLLLTLRDDLGDEEGLGCTDIAVKDGGTVLWAHNEDGNPALAERSVLLTLKIDQDPVVTCWWYPGFLPGNTFTVSECGVAWGIDHLPVDDPQPLPGRGFTARGVQSSRSLDEAISYLGSHRSAGGFAYMFCEPTTARAVVVESVGGVMAMTMADSVAAPLLWHTNHFRYLAAHGEQATGNSRERGRVLDAVAARHVNRAVLLRLLAQQPLPDGVRAAGTSLTLSTLIIDQRDATATLAFPDGTLAVLPVHDLATADTSRMTASRMIGGSGSPGTGRLRA
jgi:hypothetical protein